jgi:hypothetical protein
LTFRLNFFVKRASKKIQDGNRFKKFLQKSIERKILLQKSLFLQEFLNFQNIQFVKNTTFHESPKKKLAGIGEPMVPNRDMAGCFRKYLPYSPIFFNIFSVFLLKLPKFSYSIFENDCPLSKLFIFTKLHKK